MTPNEPTNFLVEITPEVYSEINRLLLDEDYDTIILHYSPYWKEFRTPPKPSHPLKKARE